MDKEHNTRLEILGALCLTGRGERGRELFAFTALKDEERLKEVAERLTCEGLISRTDLIRRIRREPPPLSQTLEDVHPGWILERLEGESPRLIGLLCRFLTGEKARYIINRFSPAEGDVALPMQRLPKMNESYHVSSEVADIVHQLIEKKFTSSFSLPPGGPFSFYHMVLMKADDLKTVFKDLGLQEVRKAFHDVGPGVLRTFLARFTPKEATEIRQRLNPGDRVSAGPKRDAQRHLASLKLDQLPTEKLMGEIGYSVFARALTSQDLGWGEQVCHKLPPEDGYRLKRILGETIKTETGNPSEKRKEEVLGRILLLAEKGTIRRYWK